MRQLLVGILIICFSNAAFAQNFTLLKAGVSFSPSEDLHCMTNAVALEVITKLRLCKETCEIRLEESGKLKDIEIRHIQAQLMDQKDKYLQIIGVKDQSIRKLEELAIVNASTGDGSWWKITVAVAGGIVVGAGVAILSIYAGNQ